MDYVIQAGDNLCKIAKNMYGITDDRLAYLKALEIAKENGIKLPNLIYAGQTLKLNGIEPKGEEDGYVETVIGEEPAAAPKTEAPVTAPEAPKNPYQQFVQSANAAGIYSSSTDYNSYLDNLASSKDDGYRIDTSGFNPETDGVVEFASKDVFENDKVKQYGLAAVDFATQAIGEYDTVTTNGTLNFEEFKTLVKTEMQGATDGDTKAAQLMTLDKVALFNYEGLSDIILEIKNDEKTYEYKGAAETDYGKVVKELLDKNVNPKSKTPQDDAQRVFNFYLSSVMQNGITNENRDEVKGLITAFSQLSAERYANQDLIIESTDANVDTTKFKAADKDNNGILEGDEVYAYNFSMYDQDGNNEIDAKELAVRYISFDLGNKQPEGQKYIELQGEGLYLDGKIETTSLKNSSIKLLNALYQAFFG